MEELESKVRSAMNGCSRQRLRAMKMTLHKGANVDSRVTYKDLTQVLQVMYYIHTGVYNFISGNVSDIHQTCLT